MSEIELLQAILEAARGIMWCLIIGLGILIGIGLTRS